MVENADRKVWVRASPEIIVELQEAWSRPVQAHVDLNPDGSWEMTFRTSDDLARARTLLREIYSPLLEGTFYDDHDWATGIVGQIAKLLNPDTAPKAGEP
jgi:hypothetical protein